MSLTGTDAEARPAARDASWPRTTRAEELRLQLADEIVRGVHAPGAPLDETRIANRFNVSRTPVREAIRLLAASGLVEVRPHRAALVARPDADQLAGMFEAMAELEALCAGFAAERMTIVERRALEDIHEGLRVLIQSGDPQRYHEMNEAFHNAIYDGAHNAYLATLADMGVCGLIVYLWFLGWSFLAALPIRDPASRRFTLGIIAGYAVYGLFEARAFNLGNPFSLLFLMAAFYAIVSQQRRRANLLPPALAADETGAALMEPRPFIQPGLRRHPSAGAG